MYKSLKLGMRINVKNFMFKWFNRSADLDIDNWASSFIDRQKSWHKMCEGRVVGAKCWTALMHVSLILLYVDIVSSYFIQPVHSGWVALERLYVVAAML